MRRGAAAALAILLRPGPAAAWAQAANVPPAPAAPPENAPQPANAAPAPVPLPPATPLTLAQAEATALANHPQVLAAQAASAEARQQVTEARAAYYPTISGDITGSVANGDARIGAGSLAATRLFNREGQGLQLSQLITDSGRTPNLVASSRLHAQAADQSYQATRADVLLAVDQAYFEALAAQALIAVARQTVAARQAVADQVSQLAKNNLRSQLDVSFADVNLAQAKLLLLEAQERSLGAYDELTRELGSPQAATYDLTEPPLPPALPPDPEALVATALAHRPDLLGLRAESDAAARFEKAERDLSRPTLSLVGVAGSLPWIGPDAATVPDHYQGAAINLDVPIFNGHLYSARKSAAHYRAVAAAQRVRDLEAVVARDVRTAWARASTSLQRLAVAADYLRQAGLGVDLAQGRYDLGLASIVELTQAQLSLTQAQIESLQARYGYQSQYAALQYTLGTLGAPAP
jgi:outer membrane protein